MTLPEIRIDPKADRTPSEQLIQQVCFAIAAGALSEGERLTSVRARSAEASINPNTIGKAWRDLERLGVLESRPGDGVFVAHGAIVLAREARDAQLDAELGRWVEAAASSGLAIHEIERCFRRALESVRDRRRLGESA